ncbi:unnamed protein product [Mytilus coruscus]|uniref:Uncharacterized protein n=1 Tax=Mytilus coruscus TaxID=42192 RepID=A0A6J8AD55_MYTCO|nr:unnamed protein product [Mytilus coruscus]
MNTICDNISGNDFQVYITSGSFGEGLELRGSDVDIMSVSKYNEVYDRLTAFVFNPTKTYFSLITEDTKPGFAMLRLISSPNSEILRYCEHFRRDNYLSNALLKNFFLTDYRLFEQHGPCITDTGVCNKHCQTAYMSSTISNKNQYKQYNTCLSYLLMNINHDAVSGWLMLASYFYNANQYKKSLIIIVYALSKCTLEKHFCWAELSVTQRLLVKRHLALKQGVVRLLKFLHVDCVLFTNWTFIPKELLITRTCIAIPPVVYAHFLSFLCYYNQNDVRECRNSLRDLKLTIAEDYFIIEDDICEAFSYYCLGTALQLMGDNVSAKKAFTMFTNFFPYPLLMFFMERYKRLSLIASP